MIDINLLRDDAESIRRATADKQMDPLIVDRALELDEQWRVALSKVEELRAKRNKAAKEKDIETGKRLKGELKKAEEELQDKETKRLAAINQIPNPADSSVKVGQGEKDNTIVHTWGEPTKFDFEPKDHLQLGKDLDLLDFEVGAKVSGSQFYYFKNDMVLMELALLQFGMEHLIKKGFMPYMTPDLAKSRYYLGTGYQPKGEEAQIYEIDGEDLGLIATAEVTMAGVHADEILRKQDMPLRYAAISHCFRKEAGAYGKYSKGLYRVHQFTKLEMFIYCEPKDSEAMHQEILAIEEELTQALEIPYRVVEMCTGDLGAIASKKYDLEAWMPGRQDYGEITSTSNATDFQARNLNVRYDAGGSTEYVHMLNGTALTTSRVPIAILENYQQKDGSVKVPKVLQKWMGKEVIKSGGINNV